jgi:hypothetical protein
LTELKPISVSPDFRKQPCDTVSFTSLTDGTPECDIVQKWAKAVSLPSIEAFQFVGPILPPFMPVLDWYYWRRGVSFSATQLRPRSEPMLQIDLWSIGTDFSIPVFFFERTEDFT